MLLQYNVGRLVKKRWVLGMIDLEQRNPVFCAVKCRNAATILPKIQKYVMPGCTVVTDQWRAYARLRHLNYLHLTVNHSTNFVDQRTGEYYIIFIAKGCDFAMFYAELFLHKLQDNLLRENLCNT